MKKTLILILIITLILVLPIKADIIFQEDFETDLSNWIIMQEELPDNIEITNTGYLSSNSLLLDYQNPSSYLWIKKEINEISNVLIRVFFYDNMDTALGTMIEIDSIENHQIGLGVVTNLYPNTYALRINSFQNTKNTGIQRSEGWHMFEFIITESGTYAKIDNQLLKEYNPDQTNVILIHFVSTWEQTGQAIYDELLIVSADSRPWEEQIYSPIKTYYATYKNTDFGGLYQNAGSGMHSNDLRVLFDTATIFYIYGKKNNDEQAISKAKQLYLDVLDYARWDEITDWPRGVAMSAFTYSTYTLWDELDSVTRDQAKSIIFNQAQLFLNKMPASGYIDDTKAEENAWTADFLAAVVNLFPAVPNRVQLEEKAKCFAYHSITTFSDAEYCGIKTQTVYDDYSLENHNVVNPIYALSTIHLLGRGAATYEIAGKEIPSEFQHNIVNMYNNFLKPNTNHDTFFSQNFENLDWSGATNSLYLGIYTYAYLESLGVPLDFSIDDLMLKRSIFFYDIVSEWHPEGPPQQISEYVQTDLTHPSLRWFLDSNMAGEIHAMLVLLFFGHHKPQALPFVPNCFNLNGPSTITLGKSGTYSADFYSPDGALRGEIFYDSFRSLINSGITGDSGTLSIIWTPTIPGTYKMRCRAWNDGLAECRPPSLVDNPPIYACSGPSYELTVEVLASIIGDLDLDGDVDFQDIMLLIQDFGKTGTFGSDINQDEKVNLFDIVIVAKKLI